MKGKILDRFKEADSECLLASISLNDYVEGLPEGYKSYEVQREIVKNTYLDNLVDTITEGNHIPPIVIVVEKEKYKITDSSIEVSEYKILDGLQRTFRLKIIFDTLNILIEALEKEEPLIFELSKLQLNRKFKEKLIEIESNSSILSSLVEFAKTKGSENLSALYERNQWFEIWTGLSSDQEVNKMLILNAGHKPVKTKHQLELLFRNIIPILQKVDFNDFKIVREKEMSSIQYSKNRIPGQFHFSHIITSVLSLSEGKPLTTNTNLIQKSQSDYFNEEVFDKFLHLNFLKEFIRGLLDIDNAITGEFGEAGTKWMGRETSLVGMYAATGKYINEKFIKPQEAISVLRERIVSNPSLLCLAEFENERNNQNLAKINIGSVNKKAVYEGIYSVLIDPTNKIDWKIYFKTA
jgi:hypothetical protein